MLYHLSEFEILRGVNAISRYHGGTRLGTVGGIGGYTNDDGELETWASGTYRNQWLISVELHDDAAGMTGDVAPGDHEWKVRCGFCQTQIQRAPSGGWELEIPAILLAQCPTVDHMVDLFGCMRGKVADREAKLESWQRSCQRYLGELMAEQPFVVTMNQFVREKALAYSMARGLID